MKKVELEKKLGYSWHAKMIVLFIFWFLARSSLRDSLIIVQLPMSGKRTHIDTHSKKWTLKKGDVMCGYF